MHRAIFWLAPKNLVDDLRFSSFPIINKEVFQITYVSSSSYSSSDLSNNDTPKNLVLYDLVTNGDNQYQLTLDPFWCITPSLDPKVLLIVVVFTIQCNSCSKWRLIPTKKKYEEIHDNILQNSFVCYKAWEWRHDIYLVMIKRMFLMKKYPLDDHKIYRVTTPELYHKQKDFE